MPHLYASASFSNFFCGDFPEKSTACKAKEVRE